jgi:hypothetical protein
MKKIIITMALVIATSFVSAQTYLKSIPEKGVKVYCELFIRSVLTFSDDIYYAEVDFGQRSNNFAFLSPQHLWIFLRISIFFLD